MTNREEIERRRTFAIISHPDAGKTTLTEKLLLYGGAINQAGSVKGKQSAKHAVSDWMDIEKQRGISVTSSVLQFNYAGKCVNILDTPGHQDFSEDTYRTLMAADSAVMVIDAAKGVEAQTIKLFKVCTLRHIPIFTFINKMDREARDPFELMENIDLLHKRFIVFEIDSIKDNAELFPVVTIIIMEAFINKLRRLKGVRKMLICEEAWKALSSPSMSEYLKYMYKTVRKYFGEAIVVTQEVDDIISSPIVKEAIITNSDCKILLDQKKYMNKFDGIQSMLGLTDKEKSQILSINLANHPGRKYKEVWIGLNGVQSAVYATEVSAAEYLTYTTEESEKTEVFALAEELGGDLELAIKRLAETKYK